jgi:hypothetical protein
MVRQAHHERVEFTTDELRLTTQRLNAPRQAGFTAFTGRMGITSQQRTGSYLGVIKIL